MESLSNVNYCYYELRQIKQCLRNLTGIGSNKFLPHIRVSDTKVYVKRLQAPLSNQCHASQEKEAGSICLASRKEGGSTGPS